jgi:hypothetical protein
MSDHSRRESFGASAQRARTFGVRDLPVISKTGRWPWGPPRAGGVRASHRLPATTRPAAERIHGLPIGSGEASG